MFLFGQARHPSANKYLVNNSAILTRRSCTRKPDRLLWRSYVEGSNGLWFCFTLIKAYDHVFINPFILITHFSQTPKSKLYLGNCCLRREYPRREGKWALSYWAVAKILLRFSICFISLPCTSFRRGFWYQEATKAWRRLYGVAGETLWCNAKASSWIHDRFIEWKIFFLSSLVALSLKCIVILFDYALQQRFREIAYQGHPTRI